MRIYGAGVMRMNVRTDPRIAVFLPYEASSLSGIE
jgi:hypothetical protein